MTKTAALLVWAIGIVVWYIVRHPYSRKARKGAVSRTMIDGTEWVVLTILTLGLFVVPAIYAATGIPQAAERPFDPVLAWIGAAAFVASLWLFWRTHADLGRNWSVSLKMREKHQLVTQGVYRYVRHPMYSSFLLMGVGQLLLLPNWVGGGAGLVGAVFLLLFRMRREETMMQERFGDAYRDYSARTARIVPWLI
jgi:protein-S-isoprenylcysteine O-methyltransferase Ste14